MDASTYTKYIRSCYCNHPESLGYYTQLVDYIEGCRGSQLQKPRVFDIINVQDASDPYETVHFPFCSVNMDSPQTTPRFAILEGFPSPDCIAQLGAKLSLRPELFLGHLDLVPKEATQHRQRYYEIPTLPFR